VKQWQVDGINGVRTNVENPFVSKDKKKTAKTMNAKDAMLFLPKKSWG